MILIDHLCGLAAELVYMWVWWRERGDSGDRGWNGRAGRTWGVTGHWNQRMDKTPYTGIVTCVVSGSYPSPGRKLNSESFVVALNTQ